MNPEFKFSESPIPYENATAWMEERVHDIIHHRAPECLWFLEHPPLYTAGTGAKPDDLLNPHLPIFYTGRGGRYTYHGPGQRVIYAMLDLRKRGQDLHAHIQHLQHWAQLALQKLGLETHIWGDEKLGLWVVDGGQSKKIAAFGVRVKKWVSSHGMAINLCPNLDDYKGIIPCGIRDHGVTSLEDQGFQWTMNDVDNALRDTFPIAFHQP